MGGCIKAGKCVLGEQETEWEDVPPELAVASAKSTIVNVVSKDPRGTCMVLWNKDKDHNDERYAKDVPPNVYTLELVDQFCSPHVDDYV